MARFKIRRLRSQHVLLRCSATSRAPSVSATTRLPRFRAQGTAEARRGDPDVHGMTAQSTSWSRTFRARIRQCRCLYWVEDQLPAWAPSRHDLQRWSRPRDRASRNATFLCEAIARVGTGAGSQAQDRHLKTKSIQPHSENNYLLHIKWQCSTVATVIWF